jgi:hypothetical protein
MPQQNMQEGGSALSATSSYMQEGGSALSATSSYMQEGGSALSATSPLMSYQKGVSATSSYAMSQQNMQNGGDLSVTSALPIQYDSLFGGKHKKDKQHKEHTDKVRNSSSSSPSKSGSSSSSFNINDVNASSSSSKSPSDDDSDAIIARAIARNSTAGDSSRNPMSDTTRELARMSDNKPSKKSRSSTSSNTSSSSTSTNTSSKSSTSVDSTDSGSSISSSSTPGEAIGKVNSMRYNNLLLTSPNSARSDSLINAKQFYSSENGDLYSSDSKFLRNNISRNRVR